MAELLGFQQRGCTVWLVAHPKSQIMARARAAGINTRACTFNRRLLPLELVRWALWLKQEEIQIVNTHSSWDGWLLGLASRLARVPMPIRTRHIDTVDRSPKISRHKYTLLADHVLTTSLKITNYIRTTFQLPASHVTTLPTGIDLSLFRTDGPKAGLPVKPGPVVPPVIGMVSVLRSWKGHAVFFDAVRILRDSGRDFQYVVVGGGAPVEIYAGWAQDRSVGDCVKFTGHREDVAEVLRALNVLCIPSIKHEGVPQIGLQALDCAPPCGWQRLWGYPGNHTRKGNTGRIAPAALAERIAEAVDEHEHTQKMALAGRAQVETTHSLAFMLDRLNEIYTRHLGQPGCIKLLIHTLLRIY